MAGQKAGRLAAFDFHRLVERGVYPADWAGGDEDALPIKIDIRRNALRLLAPYAYAGCNDAQQT
jgi:hypothetical protein